MSTPATAPMSVYVSVPAALQQMITQLQANGSALTDFNEGSGLRNLYEGFAIAISNQSAVADQLNQNAYLDTATGSALDNLAANWLILRKAAVQATGQITITRQTTTSALVLPAGFGQLATPPAAPGDSGVAVLTTQDATFAAGAATATVTAQAVVGGSAGNLSTSTYLVPLSGVAGIDSATGFQVTTPFTNGVDAETDDAFRARIPIAVQGQVPGRDTSFLAAALSVPGVLSAGVLPAGSTRGDGSTVPGGSVEVYYQGSAGLASAVSSAVANAAVASQNVSAYASVSLGTPRGQQRVVAAVTAYCLPGVNTATLQANVQAALIAYVNGVGIGGTMYQAGAIQAMLAVDGVVSLGLPLTNLNYYGNSGSSDLTVAGDSYFNLAASDATITVTTI